MSRDYPPESRKNRKKLTKVERFAKLYGRMRRKIVAHSVFVTEENVTELLGLDFVFLCLDKGALRRTIVEALTLKGLSFVDVGMGVRVQDDALAGQIRTTTCTPGRAGHLPTALPYSDGEGNEYAQNIQIADLNALNAALAVIKWKKLWGFYVDSEKEHQAVYGIAHNLLTNSELPG